MKNIPMILLLLTPMFVAQFGSWLGYKGFYGYIPVAVIVFGNMIYAFFLPRLGYSGKQILFWDMLLKLCNIPIFLALSAMGMFMSMLLGMEGGLFVLLIGYLLLLSSTMFGVSGLIRCYKDGLMPRKTFVTHLILHFIFVADVVSAVRCFSKMPKVEAEPEEQSEEI